MYLTRFLRSRPQSLTRLVDHYAQYPPTGLTMKRIVDFGRYFSDDCRMDCVVFSPP